MRAVVQRVNRASVEIHDQKHSEIERGLLVLLGASVDEHQEDVE